jgi:alpha-glucosidase
VARLAAVLAAAGVVIAAPADTIAIKSPGGRVVFTLQTGTASRLQYQLTLDGRPVVLTSRAGIVVDGVDLGEGAERVGVQRSSTNGEYPTRGVHAVAHDRSNDARVMFRHSKSDARFTVEVRVFDDGVAFRYLVPGLGPRTPDEATTFRLPDGAVVWSHDLRGHYEGVHVRRAIADLPADQWAAPPVTYKLPGDAGYASITEAALTAYPGMALQADGHGAFRGRLGDAHPISHPYELRYKPEDIQRVSVPATIAGPIRTPWRVILAGRDLNTLVNADVIHNVAPPPDPALFPRGQATDWVRPGRAVWRYLDGGENSYDGLEQFTELAEKLGFEYHVVEGIWQRWTPEQLAAFVQHAREHHVGIFLWKDSRALRDPASRHGFLQMCHDLGVAGAKIDFFDHEAKEMIDLYDAILREAARLHVLLDFHGANKPTGLDRTWPNELTREGVYGFEHRNTDAWGPHDATLPFTRYLAGPGDFTPVVFGERRKETSWAHQIATAAVFTSPLLVYGGHPQSLLDHPAAEIIKSIPAVWDETIVLPPSEIGEVALFARRRGRDWFVAAVNGSTARILTVPATFLGRGRYDALVVRDDAETAAAVHVETGVVTRERTITIDLRAGGGFVARLRPAGGDS